MKRMNDAELLKTIEAAWKNYEGDVTALESAIGALVMGRVFSDVDAMAIEVTKEAEQLAQVNRIEADRLREQLAQVDREISLVSGLPVDPDVMADRLAKKVILRKASELEGRREALQGLLGRLLDKANEDGASCGNRPSQASGRKPTMGIRCQPCPTEPNDRRAGRAVDCDR